MTLPRPTPISEADLSWLEQVFERLSFTYAKSMPTIPHYYTHKNQWASPEDYVRAGALILAHGTPETLFKFPVRRYLYVDGWRYWLMTDRVSESYIMNRCDPTNMVYRGHIKKVAL